MEFKCPECSHTKLNKIMADTLVVRNVDDVTDDGIVYGEQFNVDSYAIRFECRDCGFRLVNNESVDSLGGNVVNFEELAIWLHANNSANSS